MDLEAKKAQALAGIQARQLEREKQKQAASLDQEATKTFLTWFTSEKQKVDGMFTQASQLSQDALPNHFLAISSELDLMQQRTAESADVLPSHDLAQSSNLVAEYQKNLQTLKTNLLPRPKFGFKSRAKATTTSTTTSTTTATQADQKQEEATSSGKASGGAAVTPAIPDDVANTLRRLAAETPVIEIAQLENQVVYKGPGSLGGSDVMLSKLKGCTISLADISGALRAHQLVKCTILCGPIAGSFFIEEAVDCVFVIASRQGRIHKAINCEFRIGVMSKPIIENCDQCRFGPYSLAYEGLPAQLEKAGLASVTANGLWKEVQDFNWLKVDASPHWSLDLAAANFEPKLA